MAALTPLAVGEIASLAQSSGVPPPALELVCFHVEGWPTCAETAGCLPSYRSITRGCSFTASGFRLARDAYASMS